MGLISRVSSRTYRLKSQKLAIMYKPLKQFVVEYEDGDDFGKILAWISMFPFVLLFGTISVTYVKRDFKSAVFLAGLGVSLIVNKCLKELIQQPRPDSEHTFKNTNHGMPSDHTQFMMFFTVYYVLFCIHEKSGEKSTKKGEKVVEMDNFELIIKNLECLGLCGISAIVAFSRVYLRYHTIEQVLAGGSIGALLALVYFSVVSTQFVQDIITTIKTSSFGQKLKLE